MATCYHDEQDFDSDLKIEVAREGDLLKEDQELKEKPCTKNPGHHGFIPFKDLKLEHLPEDERCMEMFDKIKEIGSCVVRLVVNKTTTGTGWVKKLFNEYHIQTNNHVVETEEDVKHCSVEFFYESNNRSNIYFSHGTEFCWTCPVRDITVFKFEPVPEYLTQLDLFDIYMIYPSIVMYRGNQMRNNLSLIQPESLHDIPLVHFTNINLNDPEIDIMFLEFCDDSYSYLTSCFFKFQPIPSNIQDITNIEIHVDSTVISGDVVKCDDEYVVKISESIFQDQVRKCSLMWNGIVIGRGTRLHFQRIESSKFMKKKIGIDQELDMTWCPNYVWLFDFYPKSINGDRLLEAREKCKLSKHMCCIGHPHGGIKMVTFGLDLGLSIEQFDIHGRHIVNPGEDCQCKQVKCLNYSCKTCPGSSGSPVFSLERDFFGPDCVAHFMTYQVRKVIENLNLAWKPM